MAISPVSSVSFKNYNNLTFEGKKNKQSYPEHKSAGFMKSIPLAAMLAMSPMVNAKAETLPTESSPIELVQDNNGTSDVVTRVKEGIVPLTDCDVRVFSNSLGTLASITYENAVSMHKNVKGENVSGLSLSKSILGVDTLEAVDVTVKKMNGTLEHKKEYYVIGRLISNIRFVSRDAERRDLLEPRKVKHKNVEVEISKALYDFLNEKLGDSVGYKERTSEEEEYYDYDYEFRF